MADQADALTAFMERFLGYGSLQAETWFLGPEEAGVATAAQLLARVDAWRQLGAGPVVDLQAFHKRIGVSHLFGQSPRVQPTWRRLIEITLVLAGEEPTPEAIRRYQAQRLGRPDGNVLLGELMPLPKPSIGSWPFADLVGAVACLANRKSYLRDVRPCRSELWRATIAKHRPKRVFLYGKSGGVRKAWRKVAAVHLHIDDRGYEVGEDETTRYVLLDHPNARGRTKGYFLSAAELALQPIGS